MQTVWQTARFALDLSTPKIMGIINLTPDSFSDGGTHSRSFQAALRFSVRVQQRGGEGRPGNAAQAAFGEAAVEPAVARIEKMVASFCLVECVVSAVMRTGDGDGFACFQFEMAHQVGTQAAVLLAADGKLDGIFPFRRRIAVVDGVNQRAVDPA